MIALSCVLAACGSKPGPQDPGCPEWFVDADGDGFGDGEAAPLTACDPPDGHVGNPYDCDDDDPEIHPLAQERCDPDDVDEDCDGTIDQDDRNALGRDETGWRDADGDGHATLEYAMVCPDTPGWLTSSGRDCDDADPTVYPHADDPIDGLDTNCDRLDGPAIYDDFEGYGPDPAVWVTAKGLTDEGMEPAEGLHSVTVPWYAEAETVSIDTSPCEALAWHYQARSLDKGTGAEFLRLDYWDGAAWRPLDALPTDGGNHWTHRWGTIHDASGRHGDLRIRLRGADAPGSDAHFDFDELMVGCAVESDEDGVPDGIDCASTDPRHWFDCGTCVDADSDGFGTGCDLGRDCDDADGSRHPLAPDPVGDELDSDCTGLDGPDLFDGFDDEPDVTLWTPLVNAAIEAGHAVSPPHALGIGPVGWAISPPLDLSGCAEGIWWELQAEATPPELYDVLTLSWEGPDGWIPVGERQSHEAEPPFSRSWGVIHDAAAARSGVRFRLDAEKMHWKIDDVVVACLVDADGDLVHDPRDCAPGDPLHWFDCGQCTDGDGDGYGEACDLGEDCDDARADVHPGATDAQVDGVDQDCDGIDTAPLLFDDFGPDGLDPALWELVNDDVHMKLPTPWNPSVYVRLDGSGAILMAAPVDTSACFSVGWWARAASTTNPGGEELLVEFWDGADWALLGHWQPPPYGYVWSQHIGQYGGADALQPSLRVRLRGAAGNAYLFVDEFALGCGPQ